jgi:23S rRNA pseudoU1915 N3-methylase RlmH
MLTPGEFVVRKAMVKKYGKSMLSDINLGSFSMPRYNTGRATTAKINNNAVSASINAPVYNTYDMNFTINGTNLGADEIANQVMVRLQRSKDTMIRSNRV